MHLTKGRKMKKLLVIAVALAAVNAQATRARVMALGNSPHLVDTQTVYNNPADMFSLGGDYVTLESGATDSWTNTTTTEGANAEGMIVRTMGDAKMGLSLGHQSENASVWGLRPAAAAPFNENQQNPVEFSYGAKNGDMNWAGTLVYSNYQDKVADNKESSMGLRFGARTANWDAGLHLGLTSTVDVAATGKYTGAMALSAHGGYQMDSIYWFGKLATSGFKIENTAGAEQAKYSQTNIEVGAMTSVKKDGSEFFYGAKLAQMDSKESVADDKETSTSLPIWIGVEADAASWLTLRGSVTQTLQLLHNSKDTTGSTTNSEFAPAEGDTTVAFGAGLKFNKVTVDGALLASGSQTLNTSSLLTQVGMSYWF